MMNSMPSAGRARQASALLMLTLLTGGGVAACGDPLKVSDPTAILEQDLENAQGAELLRVSVLKRFFEATGDAAWESGLLADEFRYQPSLTEALTSGPLLLDMRRTEEYYGTSNAVSYSEWQQLWVRSVLALEKLHAYAPPGAREAGLGEVFAVRGYTALRLAEDFCPGFPLHELVGYSFIDGSAVSTDQALERALAAFDSAVTWARDSARVLNFARVGRARTLLSLGRVAEAAADLADVPTGFVYRAQYSATAPFLPNILAQNQSVWRTQRSVADREGGTGLDFISATDPRVKTTRLGTARDSSGMYGAAKYPDQNAPITVASGVEVRLIEAEAALKAGDIPTWLAKLNEPRRTAWTTIVPAVAGPLPDLTDPGSDAARLELTFRERAFWLFGTGHRLGDLRRLIRHYSRTSESVFPTGPYWMGDTYGSGTSLPFWRNEAAVTPGVTGCTAW